MEYSVDGASFSATGGTKWPWCHRMGTNDYTLLWERHLKKNLPPKCVETGEVAGKKGLFRCPFLCSPLTTPPPFAEPGE